MIDLKVISSGEYEKVKKEKQFVIFFGFHESPFGKCLIGLFGEKVCHISFVDADESVNLRVLREQWPDSSLINDHKLTLEVAKKLFENIEEEGIWKVLLKGTEFEAKVWRALTKIPKGETASYEEVASAAGHRGATRAAANAVAKNPVAYLVPCHRVIKKDGSLHKYRWGSHVKKKILIFEKRQHLKNNFFLAN